MNPKQDDVMAELGLLAHGKQLYMVCMIVVTLCNQFVHSLPSLSLAKLVVRALLLFTVVEAISVLPR